MCVMGGILKFYGKDVYDSVDGMQCKCKEELGKDFAYVRVCFYRRKPVIALQQCTKCGYLSVKPELKVHSLSF